MPAKKETEVKNEISTEAFIFLNEKIKILEEKQKDHEIEIREMASVLQHMIEGGLSERNQEQEPESSIVTDFQPSEPAQKKGWFAKK